MTEPALESRIRGVIAKTFHLTPDVAAGELRMGHPPAWDSLGHMGLVVALEREFGVRFPGHTLPTLVSVAAIAREVGKLGRPAG